MGRVASATGGEVGPGGGHGEKDSARSAPPVCSQGRESQKGSLVLAHMYGERQAAGLRQMEIHGLGIV